MSKYEKVSVEFATELALDHVLVVPLHQEDDRERNRRFQVVDLSESDGRIVAEEIRAGFPVPRFPTSIKDGYAMRARDGKAKRRIVGEIRARSTPVVDVEDLDGTAMYVTTGAPIPSGYDCVVEIEQTNIRGEELTVEVAPNAGQDIRQVGSDIGQDEVIVEPGTILGPAEIGLLAMFGRFRVRVWRKPIVAIASTGDELVDPKLGHELQHGEIFDANRYMLLAAARDRNKGNAVALDLGIFRDTESEVHLLLDRAFENDADVLITSGGVSMGDRDYIKPVLASRGKVHVGRLMMKPGKPLTFATVSRGEDTLLVFGVPGNPVSSIVTFELLIVPVLRKLHGMLAEDIGLARIHCKLKQDIRLDDVRPEYHRVDLEWDDQNETWLASSLGFQRSSRLTSMRGAYALLELPSATEWNRTNLMPKGTIVSAILISDLRGLRSLKTKVKKLHDFVRLRSRKDLEIVSLMKTQDLVDEGSCQVFDSLEHLLQLIRETHSKLVLCIGDGKSDDWRTVLSNLCQDRDIPGIPERFNLLSSDPLYELGAWQHLNTGTDSSSIIIYLDSKKGTFERKIATVLDPLMGEVLASLR